MTKLSTSRLWHYCGLAVLLFSAALWAVTTVFFLGVWDHVAAMTTFPQWSWAILGILGAMIAGRLLRRRSRMPALMLILWLLAVLYFADNLVPTFRGLVHGATPSSQGREGIFRIATLNCASSSLAAEEVIKFKPDLVLLQESPVSNEVARLAREWFGDSASFVAGLDCAILSRFPLKARSERPAVHYTQAILTTPQNRNLLITSLRLTPPLGRTDLWNPTCWRGYLSDRRLRKQQLQSILETPSARSDLPEIMGGDFNAPAGDGIYKMLGQFRDSHRVAGRGWGNTALNTIPLFRPDQIWLKDQTSASTYAIQTENSDHRMVVTDVWIESKTD